jgi:hypothetical protein
MSSDNPSDLLSIRGFISVMQITLRSDGICHADLRDVIKETLCQIPEKIEK